MKEIDATQTASGWEIYFDDDYQGFASDSEYQDLKQNQTGVIWREFPFIGFGRLQ